MKVKTFIGTAAAAAAIVIGAGSASAAVTFDPATGSGFVGKGDVQTALGLNNPQLQALGNPSFTYQAVNTVVTEVEWTCTNSNNEHTQERARTTTATSSVSGIVSSIARERNQITGFILSGYSSSTSSTLSETEGPPVNSCPANPSTFYLSTPAGDPVVISDTTVGGLYVNGVAL